MARNSEKAMTVLARWRQFQLKEQGKFRVDRRPHLASEETNLRKAEKWRYQVIRDVAKKVAQIQNGKNRINDFIFIFESILAGLSEYKIRELNDEINKLLREKSHWEDRIIELGGVDFKKTAPNRGYK
jgi:pre-mRNA-splicing factor ISY1